MAGTTHIDLIDGVQKLSKGCVNGRFFALPHPLLSTPTQVAQDLCAWIQRGAVPVLTVVYGAEVGPSAVDKLIQNVRERVAVQEGGTAQDCSTGREDSTAQEGRTEQVGGTAQEGSTEQEGGTAQEGRTLQEDGAAYGHGCGGSTASQAGSTAAQAGRTATQAGRTATQAGRTATQAGSTATQAGSTATQAGPVLHLLNPVSKEPVGSLIKDHVEQKILDTLLGRHDVSSPSYHDDCPRESIGASDRAHESIMQLCRWFQATPPWNDFNVGQQLVNIYMSMLRGPNVEDTSDPAAKGYSKFDSMVIPWGGLGGVTIFARSGTQAHSWLMRPNIPSVKVALPMYGMETEVCMDLTGPE
eukprot:gene23528-9052_t